MQVSESSDNTGSHRAQPVRGDVRGLRGCGCATSYKSLEMKAWHSGMPPAPSEAEVEKETKEMKKTHLAIATLFLFSAGSMLALAPPRYGQNGNQGQKQGAGPRGGQDNGKRTGPQDGTGPIHEPGTGGGSGAGQGRGKKLGPQDGSGPLHTPGAGGGAGAGQRRGGRR
jgi:hypothetical protein